MSREHLGERLSALIDGELGPAEHESALIHLAKCEPCRFEADMMRRLKRRLNGLCEPEPDMDFLGRLTSLSRDSGAAGPESPDPPTAGFGSGPPLGSSRPLGGLPGGRPFSAPQDGGSTPLRPEHVSRPDRRRLGGNRLAHLFPPLPGGRYAVAGFAVATTLLGGAFAVGGEAEEPPVVRPRLSDYAVEHAVTSRHMPVVDARPTATDPPHGPTEPTR